LAGAAASLGCAAFFTSVPLAVAQAFPIVLCSKKKKKKEEEEEEEGVEEEVEAERVWM